MQADFDRRGNSLCGRVVHRDGAVVRDAGRRIDDDRIRAVGGVAGPRQASAPIADVDLAAVSGRQRHIRECSGLNLDRRARDRIDDAERIPPIERHVQLVAGRAQAQTARRRRRDRNARTLSPHPAGASREDFDVVVGAAADVQRLAVGAVRDPDETVADGEGLRHGLRGQIDDVERARREVAGGGDRSLDPIRADGDSERPIVDFDLRAGRHDGLAVRKQDAAVRLDANKRDRDEPCDTHRQEQRGDQHRSGDTTEVICHDGRM